MKERFKSILLELKTSLLNPNVKKELKNDEDKEQHEKLLEFVDKYYKNIDLFEKEEEHVQKLLLKNAEELLSNTSATYFDNYYPQYLRNALFLLNNVKKEQLKKLMKNDLILTDKKIDNKDEDKLEENLVNDSTYIENDNLSNGKEISQDNSDKKLKIEPLEYNYILKNADF